jgi:hypothetical protein
MGKLKNRIDMGCYNPNKEEQAAYSWCINNGIYISPKSNGSSTNWNLLIEINKKINISPESFPKILIWKKLYEYYCYYYLKYGKTTETKTK